MVKNTPFLIRNLPENKKEQAKNDINMVETIYNLQKELECYKNELDFYKSIFKRNTNSAIFNLSIKTINGERIWYDRVMDRTNLLYSLDEDEEVIEWKKPIRCER
jgi:hypothetical protein